MYDDAVSLMSSSDLKVLTSIKKILRLETCMGEIALDKEYY